MSATALTAALLAVLPVLALAVNTYTEEFTTTAYFDPSNSTAMWDTGGGLIALHPFPLTEAGACATVGNALSVALHGDYAFVCESSVGIDVVDISDVSSPVVVCSFGTPGNAYEAVPAGNWLYVADDGGGLVVLDITSPSAPSYVANCYTPGNARDVAVAGDYAFVADREAGLVVIDISDPTAPTLAGSVVTPGLALNVELSGDLAYVSNWESGVQIIDITDPTAPFIAGSYDTPGQAWFLDLDGDFLYVGDGPAGLHILDLYSPLSPVLLSTHDTPGSVNGVTVSGGYVYLCDYGSGLRLIDATDKSAPVEVSVLDTPGSCRHLALAGEHAFVADREGGFRVVSARELYGPVLAGTALTTGEALELAVQGNLAYVICSNGDLNVFDLVDPTSPDLEGLTWLRGGASGMTAGIALAGDIAYAGMGDTLNVVDISGSDYPVVLLSGYVWCDRTYITDLFVDGDYLWVSNGGASQPLLALGVSDPTPPWGYWNGAYAVVNGLDHQTRVRIEGDNAYVMANGLLHSCDISDMQNAVVLDDIGLGGSWWLSGCSIAGDYAYIEARWSHDLLVIDITDPAEMGLTSAYDAHYWQITPVPILADGDVLFLVNQSREVVDISDPSALVRVSDLGAEALGHCLAAQLAGDYLCCLSEIGYTTTTRLEMLQVYQRRVDREHDVIQSLDIEPARQEVKWARLSTAQTGSITWFLSADGGAHWLEVAPDNRWVDFGTYTGGELLWKAVLSYEDGVVPECSSLTIEWETDDVGIDEGAYPDRFAFYQNTPNPLGQATTLRYDVPAPGGEVAIGVYDVAGRLVRTLVDAQETPGQKEVLWDGRDERGNEVASGVYYCRMRAGEFARTTKLTLIR